MTAPLTPAEAARRILADIQVQPTLRIPLDDALGAVLAEPVVSPMNVPPWTNSAMDGYAARADDVRGAKPGAPKQLRIVEVLHAGAFPTRAIGPGECARIFTGAPLPDGADSVIRQEDCRAADTQRVPASRRDVEVLNDRDCGVNIRKAGEDIQAAQTVFEAGTELGAAGLGVLASLAVAHPIVYRRPRVGILGSGDEIVDLDRPEDILSGRKIASSNTHTLQALVRQAGGVPVNLGIAADRLESVEEHLASGLECDLLVTSAGISVGEHDYLRAALERLCGELRFWKLRMRPGAPVGFGVLRGVPWIGLPGNPVSTMVTFELFVRPAIRKMMGHTMPFRRTVPVRVAQPIKLGPKLQHFLRAVVTSPEAGARRPEGPLATPNSGLPTAVLTGPQGSGILTSMIKANALLVIPEGQHETPAGAEAQAIVLDDPHHRSDPPW